MILYIPPANMASEKAMRTKSWVTLPPC